MKNVLSYCIRFLIIILHVCDTNFILCSLHFCSLDVFYLFKSTLDSANSKTFLFLKINLCMYTIFYQIFFIIII